MGYSVTMMPTDDKESLETLYDQAEYVVETGTGKITLRVGETNHGLDALLEGNACDTWAFVSAHNPRSTVLSAEENDRRHARFVSFLDGLGHRFLEGYGHSPDGDWEPETSVLILGIGPDEAVEIGRRFDQNAILTGRVGEPVKLVWCDGP